MERLAVALRRGALERRLLSVHLRQEQVDALAIRLVQLGVVVLRVSL